MNRPPDRESAPPATDVLRAVGLWAKGTVRPRRPDQRLIDSITIAELPENGPTVAVRALPQAARRVPALGLVEGASPLRRLPSAMTTFVVDHPEATFLVDPGFCHDARERVLGELPWVTRLFVTPAHGTISTADGLRRHPPTRAPDFALPTHAHWDHVSGLLDLPGLEVRLRSTERDWILSGQPPPAGGVRGALTDGRPLTTYELDGPPVATFTASHDLFGDGSILIVELAGHTPGSVGVLARTEVGWVLLAGDAAWHYEQVDRLRQKPAIPGELVDVDRDAAFAALHRLHLVRHPARVIPTHDADASAHLCLGDDSAATHRPSDR